MESARSDILRFADLFARSDILRFAPQAGGGGGMQSASTLRASKFILKVFTVFSNVYI